MNADRIPTLERQVQRLQRVTLVLALGFVWLVIWRLLPGSPVVEAREFRMRDESGAVRGAMMILDDGRPALRLNDVNGKARAMLYLHRERGAGLRLVDSTGEHRLQLLLQEGGESEIRLNDATGLTRGIFRVTEDGPWLGVWDADRRLIWSAP